MVPSQSKAPKSQLHQISRPATSAGINTCTSCTRVCLIAVGVQSLPWVPSVSSPGRRVGGLCRTRQRQRHASVSFRSAAPDLVSLHPPAGRRVSPAGLPTSVIIAHFSKYGASLSTRPLLHAPHITHVSPAATAPLWAVPTPSAFRTERTVPPPTERRSLSRPYSSSVSALTLTLA